MYMEQTNGAYSLQNVNSTGGQPIQFYVKNEDGSEVDGTTIEAVLGTAKARLEELNGKFPCRENSLAITKIQEAIMWLEERTRERKERGVEGQHVA